MKEMRDTNHRPRSIRRPQGAQREKSYVQTESRSGPGVADPQLVQRTHLQQICNIQHRHVSGSSDSQGGSTESQCGPGTADPRLIQHTHLQQICNTKRHHKKHCNCFRWGCSVINNGNNNDDNVCIYIALSAFSASTLLVWASGTASGL